MEKIIVKGMSCGHCTSSVEKTLNALDGISETKADQLSGEVTYKSEGKVTVETIAEAIVKIGFEVKK
ncbi:MAG: cation transporter [Desulfovibrio sp.]